MKAFRIKGKYSPKGKEWFKFTKDIVAEDENNALDIAYSLLGSKYGIKRRLIKIEAITEIDPAESQDPTVQYLLGEQNGQ
ncbi:MAG: 50S ribosomal protein L18a [Euryarchaeota archaeon]|nr:50S ribosomal protein L18a [Euryarchaeota archaeon]